MHDYEPLGYNFHIKSSVYKIQLSLKTEKDSYLENQKNKSGELEQGVYFLRT